MQADKSLIAHWKLENDAGDVCGKYPGEARNIEWNEGAAQFNGRDSVITVPPALALGLGSKNFTLTCRIRCAMPMVGTYGEVLSKFDTERRCGLNLWIAGSAPAYSGMSDLRCVHAGIDDGYLSDWVDCGRPWASNPLIPGLVVYRGELYASTADADKPEDACKVFRWAGGTQWVDCGRLGADPGHLSVQSMLVHHDQLYAGTGIWNWTRQKEASLTHVFRYEGGTEWTDLGQVGTGKRVLCMGSYGGDLYVGLDRGDKGGCYKYANGKWIFCGRLDETDNFECLMPVGGTLYGSSHQAIYVYEGGEKWRCIGRRPHGISQIHSMHSHEGKLIIGTWKQGYVLRYEGGEEWSNMGLLGLPVGKPEIALINEINSLCVYNGKLYAGVLPKAQVFRYESDGHWTLIGNLAWRADYNQAAYPTWMRVLAMTAHQGRLFACTGSCMANAQHLDPDLSVGRVLACRAGQVVSHEQDIGGEWTQIAVVRQARELSLYINGRLSAASTAGSGCHLDLLNGEPLRIGSGALGYFHGAIRDVRLYDGALDSDAVRMLG